MPCQAKKDRRFFFLRQNLWGMNSRALAGLLLTRQKVQNGNKKNPSRPIQRVCSVENKKDQQATAKKKFEPKKHPTERTDGWWMGTEKGSKVSLVLRKAATCCCYGASVPEKRSVCLLPSSLTFVVFPCCHTPPQTSFLPVISFPLASSMIPTEARLNHIKL